MVSDFILNHAKYWFGRNLEPPVTMADGAAPEIRQMIVDLSSADKAILLRGFEAADKLNPRYLAIALEAHARHCKIPSLRPRLIRWLIKFTKEHLEYYLLATELLVSLGQDPSPAVRKAAAKGLAELHP